MIHTKITSISLNIKLLEKIDFIIQKYDSTIPRSVFINNMLEYLLKEEDPFICSFLKEKEITMT
jgi:metal-responsive CopG/Arc/MetJ family transcriptional regulator